MSIETSPYEGQLDRLNGKLCFGRVVSVDATSRTARCRTLGNAAHGTDDQDLTTVKIMHTAWHPDGSYAVAIPPLDSLVIIGFVNSEAVLFGAYPISNTFGGGGRTNQEDLLPGDYAFVTAAGSRVIIRSGGTVEIESTKGCRTYWLPKGETINSVCQNYELEPSGGFIHWYVDEDTQETQLHLKAYDSADEAVNAVDLKVGTTDSGALLDLNIGPTDGEYEVTAPTLSLQVQADGSTDLDIAAGKFTASIDAEGNATVTAAGDVELTTTGDITASSGGTVSIEAATAQKFKAPLTAIGADGTELLEQLALLIDAIGKIQILTRVGQAAPIMVSAEWADVAAIKAKIVAITGSL